MAKPNSSNYALTVFAAAALVFGAPGISHAKPRSKPSPSPSPLFTAADEGGLPFLIGPILEGLEGLSAISLRGKNGEVRTKTPGELLALDDALQTTPTGAAWIAYENDSHLLVGTGTLAWLGEEFGAKVSRIPWITVKKGEIRVLIESGEGKKHPEALKFLVSTEHGWIGARGTDFVVAVSPVMTQVRTLNGTVEIARTQQELRAGTGWKVPAGQFAELLATEKGINLPRAFNVGEWTRSFEERQRGMGLLWKGASQAAHDGRVRAKFAAMRKKLGLK